MRPYTVIGAIIAGGVAAFVGYRTTKEPSLAPIAMAEPQSVSVQSTLAPPPHNSDSLSDPESQSIAPEVVEDIAPQRVLIDFGGGLEPIEVDVRRPRVPAPPEPTGRLVDQYEALATAARDGDGAAARMLFVELKICEMHLQWQAKASASSRAAANQEPPEAEARCDGLNEAHFNNYVDWAKLAADSGDYMGRQYVGAALGQTPEALAKYESFWNDGNASALPAMSWFYGKGIVGGEPDWVKAYAMHLIYFKLSEASQAIAQARGHPVRRFTHQSISDHLHYLSGMLSPGQQQEAQALAHRSLANNKKCCIGSF